MTKRLIDIDDEALAAARHALGTATMKETVNEALRRAVREPSQELTAALDRLADLAPHDRSDAWR